MSAPGEKNLYTNTDEVKKDTHNKVEGIEAPVAVVEDEPVAALLTDLEAQEASPKIEDEVNKKAESYGVELSPEKKDEFNEKNAELDRRMSHIQMKGDEESYLVNHKAAAELEERYNTSETHPDTVLSQIADFSESVGISKSLPEGFAGQPFGKETMALLQTSAKERIAQFLLNKETGRVNPAKNESLIKQTERYLELITQAQQEGDMPSNLSLEDVSKMVFENIDKLAFQDRVAAENLLGDHGIRHLVDHNIMVTEQVYNKLAEQGQLVKAIDRLMTHQIMIDHDLGYAMSPVRDRINEEGIKGQDAGHNLLAAKFISERIGNPDDHFNKVFANQDFVKQIHAGILNHDSSKLEFTIGDESATARQKNLESAIHLADNTHAFEDKLPELLYAVPETLKYMRLMKVAGDTGDTEKVEAIKQKLVEHIQSQEDFSPDDKAALAQAVKGVSAESYRFSVGRICGNKPTFEINQTGKVEITVQESAIHREVMAVFDQSALNQLKKFIKDLGGPTDIDSDATSIDTEKILFKLATGEAGKSEEKNDYQERVMSLITEEKFRTFMIGESDLSRQQDTLEKIAKLDMSQEENSEKILALGKQLGAGDGPELAMNAIQTKLAEIKQARQGKLNEYLS
jgi:hypothetical protein